MNALETKVLELIGEDPDSPDVFVDTDAGMAPIRDSLNDAIQEIVSLTGSKATKYYLPLRQDQMFYRFDLNNGFLGWITDVWLVNETRRLEQTDLIRLVNHDPRWMTTSASPRSYWPVGLNVVGFYPKPSGATDTIELTIVEIPKAYTDQNDRIHLRDDFEYAAVNYAVAEYWASRGDARQAETHMGYYMNALGLDDGMDTNRNWAPRLETRREPLAGPSK